MTLRPMPVVVGVPRSGTTLLRMMLDAHPDMAVPPETGFLPDLAQLPVGSACAAAAAQIITTFHTWPDFHLDAVALRHALADDDVTTPAGAARAFYRIYARRFGKTRWGDKTPTYADALLVVATLLPEAHFVHVIRDGRDVALSVRKVWFRPGSTLEDCARDWAGRIARARGQAGRVPHYLELRYEALVTSPEATLRELCRFLELDFDPAMLRFHERAAMRLAEHEPRFAADGGLLVSRQERLYNQRLVMEPPRPDRIGRWRVEMSEDEQARFAEAAGGWLNELAYDRPVARR